MVPIEKEKNAIIYGTNKKDSFWFFHLMSQIYLKTSFLKLLNLNFLLLIYLSLSSSHLEPNEIQMYQYHFKSLIAMTSNPITTHPLTLTSLMVDYV
jgi:hypothetical protein